MSVGIPNRSDAELTQGHLWQIDVVRIVTFCAVIAVHSISLTQQPSNQVAAGALMLLQFGREVFFVLTGFVLVYAAQRRTPATWAFWRRRLPTAVVPYLAWTAIYLLYSTRGPAHLQPTWSTVRAAVVSGSAAYHLYFLLVIMQLYAVFPALLRFVRRTGGRPWRILVPAAVLNLCWLAAVQYVRAPAGVAGFFWRHAYELLPTYMVYVLAGCYAALHLAQLQSFVERHRRPLMGAAVTAGALGIGAYLAQLGGRAPRDAGAVLQPAMLLPSAGAAILLYVAGSRWAAGRRRHERIVAAASDISFGVYLAHPLFLALLADHGLLNAGPWLSSPLATLIGFVVPLVGAAALTVVVRRTPVSFLLAGRPQLRRRARAYRLPQLVRGVASLAPAPAIDRDLAS